MANAVLAVTANSALKIIVDQSTQYPESGTTDIHIQGQLINNGGAPSKSPGNDIGRSIEGTVGINLSHFGIEIAGMSTVDFIDEIVNVQHGADGTLTVNFSVGYGITGTTLFLSNKRVGVSNIVVNPLKPGTPNGLKLSNITSDSLTLSWNASASAQSYYVDQWPNTGGTGTPIRTQVFGLTIDISGLTPGSGYRYQVTATNAQGNGPASSPITTTLTSAATAPSSPTFTNVSARSLTVKWVKPSSNGGSTITGYRVSRYDGPDTSGGSTDVDTTGTGTSLAVTGLSPGATYTFVVIAKNSSTDNGGLSAPSAPSTVTLLAGAWVRIDGAWQIAIPYVRHAGTWQLATPYVRVTKNTIPAWNLTD
jgi:hypothetical protein